MKPEFRVCITGRNHAAYTAKCVRSVLEQKGPCYFRIDWTDDASSTDEAFNIAHELISDRFNNAHLYVFRNSERVGGLANLWRAIQRADDDEIVVLMGGDDYIADGALQRLAKLYEDPECWMTYGTFQNSNGTASNSSFEWDGSDMRDELREFLWMPLSCRAWLAKKVLEEDLKIAGYWQWSSGDVALNVPIVEMAGPEHARWIEEPWYTRRIHEGNDTATDAALQYFCSWRSYGRPRYSRLRDRDDMPERTPHKMKYGLIFHPDGKGNRSMPQGTQYGNEQPFDPKNKAIMEWVGAEVRKSRACPTCQGLKRCDCEV